MTIEFRFPVLGENIHDVTVTEVLVKCGDQIVIDQTVLEVETEKAHINIPCPYAGRIESVHITSGATIRAGSILLTISESSKHDRQQNEIASSPSATSHSPTNAAAHQTIETETETGASVFDFAARVGVDLRDVRGTNTDGSISQEDVESYMREVMTAKRTAESARTSIQLPDFSCFGPVDREKLSQRRITAAGQLHKSWQHIPHVTHHDIADITELEQTRQRYLQNKSQDGPKVTLTSIVLKACVQLLIEMPHFNSSLDAERDELVLKRYYHIGVAIDTEFGLVVPVIHDVDKKSIPKIASDLVRLTSKARQGKLNLQEMRGASFTVTNLGGIGGTALTPIVNQPEVAILGLARARSQPVFVDGVCTERLILPLSISFDHRVINGADAARFLVRLSTSLNTTSLTSP
jgi:pyruvate dehydrogenase E2 component (dihydrolipoamide acetyltransferase)